MAIGSIGDDKRILTEELHRRDAFSYRMPALCFFTPDSIEKVKGLKDRITDPLKDYELFHAAKEGDLEKVLPFLSEKRVDEERIQAAFLFAVEHGQLEMVRLLLEHREFAETFLIHATFLALEIDFSSLVYLIVEKRSFSADSIEKIILKSIEKNRKEVFLLLKDRIIFSKKTLGKALLLAIENNHQTFFEEILAMGDLSKEDYKEALKRCVKLTNRDLFRFLMTKVPYDVTFFDEVFIEAIDCHHEDIIDLFLSENLVSNRVNMLALNSLVKRGRLESIEKIFNYFTFFKSDLAFSIQLARYCGHAAIGSYLKKECN